MGQVTIYLEDEIEAKMSAAAKAAGVSKSKWITGLIKDKMANEWPQSIIDLAGSWKDLPTVACRHSRVTESEKTTQRTARENPAFRTLKLDPR